MTGQGRAGREADSGSTVTAGLTLADGPTGAESPPSAEGPAIAEGPTVAEAVAAPAERTVDARLARLHLRGGLLALARAELEQMAGAGTLDLGAMADLAEVRWRNGDLMGAAEAASAHLEAGGEEPIALLVCAEALDHAGHLLDARALAAQALERVGGQVDRLFAGQPRSSAWSSAGSTPMPLAPGTMTWGGLAGGLEVHQPTPRVGAVPATLSIPAPGSDEAVAEDASTVEDGTSRPAYSGHSPSGDARSRDSSEPGRGSDRSAGPSDPARTVPRPAAAGASSVPALPGSISERVESGRAAGKEIDSIERAIDAERLSGVAERLALLLRTDRALAAGILSLADRALAVVRRDDPIVAALHLVRGDAYLALGRGSDARAAFQRSLRAVAARTTDKEHP